MLAKHIKIGNLYRLPERWSYDDYKLLAGDLVLFLDYNVENSIHVVTVLHNGKICLWELDDLVHINKLQSVDLNDD